MPQLEPERTFREFVATNNHVGDRCYLCGNLIKMKDLIRYYSGPFLVHCACIPLPPGLK